MWRDRHEKGVAWGDTRIENVPDVLRLWREFVLSSPRTISTYPVVYGEERVEEDVLITLWDLLLVCVKFLEVLVYVAFVLVCVVLVCQCCTKAQERRTYTTI
eukprot:gene25209-30451_t